MLNCSALGDPSPMVTVTKSGGYFRAEANTRYVVYRDYITSTGITNYTCLANNTHGSDTEICFVRTTIGSKSQVCEIIRFNH